MTTFRFVFHMFLHLAAPALAARLFWPRVAWRAWLVMTATLIADADHLLSAILLDPCRCSIGFHPLHSVAAIAGYALLTLLAENAWLRWIGVGLLLHMALDGLDCLMMAC